MWCAYKRDLTSYLQVILRIIGYVHTTMDTYCTSRKKIPDRASVHGDFGAISVTERSYTAPAE